MSFKMHKIIIFPRKKCVPTQPKIFKQVTRNTFIFLFGLILLFSIFSLQCTSKNAGQKEMYTLGISNFPIPGEPRFPLNAMFTKAANRGEEGMLHGRNK